MPSSVSIESIAFVFFCPTLEGSLIRWLRNVTPDVLYSLKRMPEAAAAELDAAEASAASLTAPDAATAAMTAAEPTGAESVAEERAL